MRISSKCLFAQNYKNYVKKQNMHIGNRENMHNEVRPFETKVITFIISSRGNKDEYLFDSEGKEYKIIKILNEFNNSQQTFVQLKNKPKIFLFDFCQTGTNQNKNNKNNNNAANQQYDSKSQNESMIGTSTVSNKVKTDR